MKQTNIATSIAIKQIECFTGKRGNDVLSLAMHLAFPLATNSGLAHKIRKQFCKNIAWVSVSDSLLSPLWHKVEDDIYEIDPEVRSVLLDELKEIYGKLRLEGLAKFVLEETPKKTEKDNLNRLMAYSFINKEKASQKIIKRFNKLDWNKTLELIRVGTVTNMMKSPLIEDYPGLFTIADAMLQYAYGDKEKAICMMEDEDLLNRDVKISGINLRINLDINQTNQTN
jgi:hypothetical protein